eukprot:5432592-Pleurochrysis_carterae.AAC.1
MQQKPDKSEAFVENSADAGAGRQARESSGAAAWARAPRTCVRVGVRIRMCKGRGSELTSVASAYESAQCAGCRRCT